MTDSTQLADLLHVLAPWTAPPYQPLTGWQEPGTPEAERKIEAAKQKRERRRIRNLAIGQ